MVNNYVCYFFIGKWFGIRWDFINKYCGLLLLKKVFVILKNKICGNRVKSYFLFYKIWLKLYYIIKKWVWKKSLRSYYVGLWDVLRSLGGYWYENMFVVLVLFKGLGLKL